MPANSLVFRFIGIDDGAGAQFDRLAGKADLTAASFKKFGLGAAATLAAVAVGSVKAAAQYQMLTENLVTGAGEQQQSLAMVRAGMLDMAGQVGDSANTLAKAMFLVESAGYHGASGLQVLKIAAEGAKVDGADLTTTVDALTSALNAYHAPVSDAAKYTNVLIASAAAGKMHLQDLAGALGTVLPIASVLHVPLAQVGAAMATMTQQGTNANRAATSLRYAFSALANPTAKAEAAMRSIGLTSTQVSNSLTKDGLPATMLLLENAAGKAFPDSAAKYDAALANMVGGTRGMTAILELTGRGLVTMDQNLGTITARARAAGDTVSDWSAVQKNFNQQLDELGASAQATAIRLGTGLLPVTTDLLHALEDGGHVLAGVTGTILGNKVAADALAVVLASRLVPAAAATVTEFTGMAATGAVSVLTRLGTTATEAAAAFYSADGAVAGFGAALDSLDINPIVATIAAAAAAAYELHKHMDSDNAKGIATLNRWAASLNTSKTSVQSMDHAVSQLQAMQDALGQGGGLIRGTGLFKDLTSQLDRARGAASAATANYRELTAQYGLSAAKAKQLADVNHIDMTGSFQSVAAAMSATLTPTQLLAHDNEVLKNAAAGSANAVQSLTDKLNTLIGGPLAAHQAAQQFASDLRALTKAAHDNTGKIDDNTKAGQGNARMLTTLAGDISSSLSTWEQQGKTADQIKPKLLTLEKALLAQAVATTGNKKAVDAYLGSMHLLPGQIDKILSSLSTDTEHAGQGIDNGLIKGMQDRRAAVLGLASDIGAQAAAKAAQGAGVHSPSTKTAYVGRMLAEGLIKGWTGESARIKDALSNSMQDALDELGTKIQNALSKEQAAVKKATSTLHSELATRRSDIKSLAGSISSGADISGIFGTDANGNPTMGNAAQFLTAQVGPLKQEAEILKKLRARHMKAGLLAEIADLPVAEAIQVGNQFLSGGSSIATADRAYAEIQKYSTQGATTVTDALTQHAIEKERAAVKHQTKVLERIEHHLDEIARHAGADVARHIELTLKGGSYKLTRADAKEIARALNEYRRNVNKNVFPPGNG
jgi:TP901 family phage tail tape measure protein